MSVLISVSAIVTGLTLIYFILENMKQKKMTEAQSVGWLIGAIVIILLGVFPKIIPEIAGWFGIWYPPTILVFVVIVLLLFIVFQHTTNISQLINHVNELTMQVTLLKDENEMLQKKLEAWEGMEQERRGHEK